MLLYYDHILTIFLLYDYHIITTLLLHHCYFAPILLLRNYFIITLLLGVDHSATLACSHSRSLVARTPDLGLVRVQGLRLRGLGV